MCIGIDARLYGPQNGGIGRYLQNLLENLEEIDKTNQYAIFLRAKNWDAYRPRNPNFTKVLADYRPYSLKEQLLMPWLIRRQKVDLMHFPHFNAPVFYRGRFVVTIHDLIPLHFSGRETSSLSPLLFALKRWMMKFSLAAAVKRSAKIIAVSAWTKNDIVKHFSVPPEKIEVIYEGAPEAKSWSYKVIKSWSNGVAEPRSETTQPLSKYGLAKPYLLYVGAAYPHKNLAKLLEAFKIFKIQNSKFKDYKLVLVGREDAFYRKLKQQAEDFKMDESVIFPGFVLDEYLPELYRHAALYVFPSLLEGFGLPPLEAMAHGVPVACSNASCLPEILGEAAEYFDPTNIGDMAEVIAKILFDARLQEAMRVRGLARIKEFSWRKMAAATEKIYAMLVNS